MTAFYLLLAPHMGSLGLRERRLAPVAAFVTATYAALCMGTFYACQFAPVANALRTACPCRRRCFSLLLWRRATPWKLGDYITCAHSVS